MLADKNIGWTNFAAGTTALLLFACYIQSDRYPEYPVDMGIAALIGSYLGGGILWAAGRLFYPKHTPGARLSILACGVLSLFTYALEQVF